ncbi:DUF4235 domain-containing protein [Motilibacter aurantiacus]|uniref:DUF4235 domain-containing protein n=1 Tax=Motilibacter aurantiacus TaxID=2714955 RepID=UPI00140D3FFA|nr:DUF4235 domain-containing protein [Motilibacter aurantiacus]NHC46580.1 DUF4235 domain-containing protein [Motilibacter aurantiacus]
MGSQGSGGVGFKALTALSAIAAAWVGRKSVTGAWKAITGNEPPVNPEDPDVSWQEAVGWALISGAVIGLTRLVATRQATVVWRKATGYTPSDLQDASS